MNDLLQPHHCCKPIDSSWIEEGRLSVLALGSIPKLPLQVLVFDYETEGSQTIVYTWFHVVYSSVFLLVLIIHNDTFSLLKIIY